MILRASDGQARRCRRDRRSRGRLFWRSPRSRKADNALSVGRGLLLASKWRGVPRDRDIFEPGALEGPTSRFTLSAAVALGVPEREWSRIEASGDGPAETLRRHFG